MTITKVPYQDTTAMGVFLKNGPAPVGGAVFSLGIKAGQSSLISFPATVIIPEGKTGVQFEVTWIDAGTTILQAQLTEIGGVVTTGIVYDTNIECIDVSSVISFLVPADIESFINVTIPLTVVFSNVVSGDQSVSIVSSNEIVALPQSPTVIVTDGTQIAVTQIDILTIGTAIITATHTSGVKQSNITIVSSGVVPVCTPGPYGQSSFELRPYGQMAIELIPVGISAKEVG